MTQIVPLVRETAFDAEPAELLARLMRGSFAFLLESAEPGGRFARYTFLGTEPREAWRYTGELVERWTPASGWREEERTKDPIGHIGALMRARAAQPAPGLPGFQGGAVGFVGYDVVRTLERLPEGPPREPGMPDALFLVTDLLVVLDNERRTASVIASVEVPEGASEQRRAQLYGDAESRVSSWLERLQSHSRLAPRVSNGDEVPAFTSRTPDERFMQDVTRLKEHIAAGDIFQAVLSRRLEVHVALDPLELYRALRALNPSPYLYYLKLDDVAIVGSSPEVLVRVEDRDIIVRPIAGTHPRGRTPDEDAALERRLLADVKELAEHEMLVDLGRNDVGRVAAYGSVRVTEHKVIERYAHVLHIVSEVRGRLADGEDAVSALKACFPAGTVSGAPKVRAMELLNGLEPVRRGPYAGAVGYLGFGARHLDTAIAIRTAVVRPDRVQVQVGAGIVADSDPASELAETGHKSRSLLLAIARARKGPSRR